MTTAAGQPRRQSTVAGWVRSTRQSVGYALDRPLASYYLLLGASTLLLTIGLMMVLSASSVSGYKIYGNSYHYFFKQLMWVGLALPIAFLASRLPHRFIRRLAWPEGGVEFAGPLSVGGPVAFSRRTWDAVGGYDAKIVRAKSTC